MTTKTENKFILGDCMNPENGLPSYPDNYFDLAIVDPPYGIGASRPSKKPSTTTQKNGKKSRVKNNNYEHKDWDDRVMNTNYFSELCRVSKRRIIWGANYQDTQTKGGRLIWDKLNGESDQYDGEIASMSWTNRVEIVYYMWAGMFQGLTPSRDVLKAMRQRGDKKTNEARIHPTQKPVIMYQWLLENYAKPGDHILDTHVGSASSLIACESMGFRYTGFEIDPNYYKAAENRMAKGIQTRIW